MYRQLTHLLESTFEFVVGITTTVLSRLLPNVLVAFAVLIVIAWYNTSLWHEIQRSFWQGMGTRVLGDSIPGTLTHDYRWLMGYLSLAIIVIADLFLISLFARRWRARRWGRKPPEIERSTRYFMG